MSSALYDEFQSLPEVADVRRVSVSDGQFGDHPIKIVATDMDVLFRHAPVRVLEGSADTILSSMQRGAVTVSGNFARRSNVHQGDTIALAAQTGTANLQVAGVLVDYTSDAGSVLMDRATYLATYGDDRVGAYELHLANGSDREAARMHILDVFEDRYDLFILSNQEALDDIEQRIDQVFSLLRALEGVALLVSILGIFNTLSANILDRTRELAVLRAVGMKRRPLQRMVVLEGVLMAWLGLVVGVAAGSALGWVMLTRMNIIATGWDVPFHMPGSLLAQLAFYTLVAATIAGLVPARTVSRQKVAAALSYE